MFLLHLRHITLSTRHADQHIFAKAKAAIVPAAQVHRLNIQRRPLRKLAGNQRADLLSGDDNAVIHDAFPVSGANL